MTHSPPSQEPFLVFGQPDIAEAEIAEVADSMRARWLGTGPKVARFENAFAQYRRAEHVAAVSSCTAALHLSLLAARVAPGDEVITTPMTFCATVNAIIHAGAVPVLADIDPRTLNIDPLAVAARIGPRTRAIVPVHFAGRPCDMDALTELADRHGLQLIEDCAHAIESEYRGRPVGTFGDFGCFSFYATKNITTGEGGMVIGRREEDISRIKTLALHGMTKDAWRRFGDDGYKHYFVVECGFKYNMMDLQAAIGLHQLDRIEASWRRRQAIWAYYQDEFKSLPLILPAAPQPDTRHAHHLYTLQIDPALCRTSRDAFLQAMTRQRIGVGVHYLSIPEHPFYQERFGWKPEQFPHAMTVGRQTVSIPLSPSLSDSDVARVCAAVRRSLQGG